MVGVSSVWVGSSTGVLSTGVSAGVGSGAVSSVAAGAVGVSGAFFASFLGFLGSL